jgi:hypothetical protein
MAVLRTLHLNGTCWRNRHKEGIVSDVHSSYMKMNINDLPSYKMYAEFRVEIRIRVFSR